MIKLLILLSLFSIPALGDALPIVTVTEEQGATQYSLTLQLLALMTLLSVLPAMLLGLTSFVSVLQKTTYMSPLLNIHLNLHVCEESNFV